MPKVAKGRKFRSLAALRKSSATAATVAAPWPVLAPDGKDDAAKPGGAAGETSGRRVAKDAAAASEPVPPTIRSGAKETEASGEAAAAAEKKSKPMRNSNKSVDPAGSADATDDGDRKPPRKAALSRGQRKRQAKREQYLRREKMIMSSLRLRKAEEQARRIDGLDAIKEALLATVSSGGDGGRKKPVTANNKKDNLLKSNKGRQRLVQKEVAQMDLVLKHPAYRADPLATMREHLRNSIAANRPREEPRKKEEPEQKEKAKRKRHKSKYRATRSRKR